MKFDVKRILADILTIPNLLSLFRICLIPVIVEQYCVEEDLPLTGQLLLLSGFTDVLDGFLARRFHMISNLGKVLDPIADKLTQTAMLICLLLRYPRMILPLITMVIKETFMAITGYLVVRRKNVVYGANWHGKAATVLLYAMMMLHVFWQDIPVMVSDLSILVCTVMIGVSFALYGARNLKALKQ